jgi:group I intron endonuclease
MKPSNLDKRCGIYCIKNKVNNKVYIGKSINIYSRLYQHLSNLNTGKRKSKNSHLLNAWEKYGRNNFEYFVLEYLEPIENLVKERELYWILKYNSIDRNYGYNLRLDSETKMIVHEETSLKISERLKKEWSEGLRNNHSRKLSKNWSTNNDRKIKQSIIMKKNLTKYYYNVYDENNNFIKKCNYQDLIKLKLKSVLSNFHRNKDKNIVKIKNYFVERIKI